MDGEIVVHLHSEVILSGKKHETLRFSRNWKKVKETIMSEVPSPKRTNMACT